MLAKTLDRLPIPLLVLLSALPLHGIAQQTQAPKSINLVTPNGNGRIVIPARTDVLRESLVLYDRGTRPVFFMASKNNQINVSYILFPNTTGSSSPQICRDDVLNAAIRSLTLAGKPDVRQIEKDDHPLANGRAFAIGSFFVASSDGEKMHQESIFGVSANSTTCAEIHISKESYKPADEPLMKAQLNAFTFEPDYVPTPQDYFTLGNIFYSSTKSYESAALYYQRALDTLPANTELKSRRLLIDQLAMAYGISGQIKQSWAVNQAAIQTDPDYPLYYYNLACIDAELGHAADAKLHLQQAFDRKANTIPGEHLPDPTKDDSILKLKKDKDFWTFVQTLK
jgi:tetratricopeptide (TPR) repeat protein